MSETEKAPVMSQFASKLACLEARDAWHIKRIAELEAKVAELRLGPCGACDGEGRTPTGLYEQPYRTCRTCLGSGKQENK